jgi:hypothetical protein
MVLRTDFSDQSAWESVRDAIREPVRPFGGFPGDEFCASVEFVDDVAYQDITKEQLLGIVQDYDHSFIILVDQTTISLPEFPLLVVDLREEPGREFRAIPSQIGIVEANLSLANMDFHEFADFVDEDGVLAL